MTVFFWIELRRIGWQILAMDLRMLSQISLGHPGTLRLRPIPDQNERATDPAADMLQTDQQFLGIDAAIEMALVDLAADRQSHHGRSLASIFRDPFELWGLPFGCPGKADRFNIGQAKLIFKDDLGAEPLRFFLSVASLALARPGSTLHPVRWRVRLAFAHSSPNRATSD